MTELPQPVREELTRSGWHPGRRVPLDDIRPEMHLEGDTITPAAEGFLSEYADLWMKVRDPASGTIIDSFDAEGISTFCENRGTPETPGVDWDPGPSRK